MLELNLLNFYVDFKGLLKIVNDLKFGKLTFVKALTSINLLSANESDYKTGALMNVMASILHK